MRTAALRVIPTVVLCTLLAAPAAAQVDVGFKAGVSVSRFALTPTPPDVVFGRTESTLGLFAVWPTQRRVDWQLEMMVSPAGSRIETADERAEFRLTYLDLAPLARATLTHLRRGDLYALAGPSFGLLLNATEVEFEDDERKVENVDDLFTTLDLGLTVGLGLDLGRLVFEGRCRFGFTDVSTVPPRVSSEIRNRAITFLGGFRF